MTNCSHMLEQQLAELGFSKHEITVYITLFLLGKVRAGELIEKTNLHRNLVYTALDALVLRGLVSKTTSNGVARFVANNPERLVEEQEERKRLAEAVAERLKEKQEYESVEVAVYEGVDGIKRVRKDMRKLSPGDTVYVMGRSSISELPILDDYLFSHNKALSKRGIEVKLLYDKGVASDIVARSNKHPGFEAKYLPFEVETPLLMSFFKDHLDVTVWNQKFPITFSLRGKGVADGFKKYFDYFWNQEVNGICSHCKNIV